MSALSHYAERIDSGSLRERLLVFVASALVLVMVFYYGAINPMLAHRAALSQENQALNKQLDTMQRSLQRLFRSQATEHGVSLRHRIDALRAQLGTLDARVAAERHRFTPPQRMRVVLEGVLERDPQLKLIDLKTLPVVTLGDGKQATPGHRIFRHGIELTVSGSYLDLYRYLSALERLPTQLYWGRAQLEVTHYPTAVLKLTVYTVSFDKAWLVV